MGRTSELAPTLRRTNSSPIIIIENPAYIDKKKISSPSQGGDNLTKPRFKYNFIPDWARRGIKLNKPNFKQKKIPRIMSMPQRDYLSFNLVVNPFYNATETYVTSRPVNSHQTSGNESAETEKGKRKSNFENQELVAMDIENRIETYSNLRIRVMGEIVFWSSEDSTLKHNQMHLSCSNQRVKSLMRAQLLGGGWAVSDEGCSLRGHYKTMHGRQSLYNLREDVHLATHIGYLTSRLNNQDIGHRFHIHDDCPQVREGQVDERLPPLDIEDEPDEGSSVS